MSLPFTIEHTGPNVTTVRLDVPSTVGWERWFLLRSDAHHDHPDCDRALETRHLDQALERDAGILDFGDLFCAMQGRDDRRGDKGSIRPEHQGPNYFDLLLNTTAEDYSRYAHHWVLMGQGNHESAVLKRNEIDLLDRLSLLLNERTGSTIHRSGYTGWVRLHVKRCHESTSRILWFTHGSGAGGAVTLGVPNAHRESAYVENADYMVSGHTHDSWHVERVRLRLNDIGRVERRTIHQIKLPTYKNEYSTAGTGWAVERGMPPKPLGAWWLRLYWDGPNGLREQVIRAD